MRSLDVSARGALQVAIIEAKDEWKYSTSVTTKATHTVLHAKVVVDLAPHRLQAPVRLKPQYQAMIERGDLAGFQESCGDSFVYKVHRGGRLNIFHEFMTKDRHEQHTIESEGSGRYAVFSGGHNVKTVFETWASKNRMTTLLTQDGGISAIPVTLEQVQSTINEYALKVPEDAKAFSVTLKGYDEIPGIRVSVVRGSSDYDDVAALYFRMTSLAALVRELRDDVELTPDRYWVCRGDEGELSCGEIRPGMIGRLLDRLDADVGSLRAHIRECLESERAVCAMPAGFSLDQEYEYRAQLPVQKDSFAEETGRRASEKALARKKREASGWARWLRRRNRALGDAVWQTIAQMDEDGFARLMASGRMRDETGRGNRADIKEAVREYWSAERSYRQFRSTTWLRAMLDERIRHWITRPDYVRCAQGLSFTRRCLTDASLNAFRARMYAENALDTR